jgi:hypothetical protein
MFVQHKNSSDEHITLAYCNIPCWDPQDFQRDPHNRVYPMLELLRLKDFLVRRETNLSVNIAIVCSTKKFPVMNKADKGKL